MTDRKRDGCWWAEDDFYHRDLERALRLSRENSQRSGNPRRKQTMDKCQWCGNKPRPRPYQAGRVIDHVNCETAYRVGLEAAAGVCGAEWDKCEKMATAVGGRSRTLWEERALTAAIIEDNIRTLGGPPTPPGS